MRADQGGANWSATPDDPRWPAGPPEQTGAAPGRTGFTGHEAGRWTEADRGSQRAFGLGLRGDTRDVGLGGRAQMERPGIANPWATRWLPGWRGGSSAGEGWGLPGSARRGLAGGCAVAARAGVRAARGARLGAGVRAGAGLAVPVGSGSRSGWGGLVGRLGPAVPVGSRARRAGSATARRAGVRVRRPGRLRAGRAGSARGWPCRVGWGVAVRVGCGVAAGGLADPPRLGRWRSGAGHPGNGRPTRLRPGRMAVRPGARVSGV